MNVLTVDNWKEELSKNSVFVGLADQLEPIMKEIVDERFQQALDAFVNLLGAMEAMEFVQSLLEEKTDNHDEG